LLALGHPGFVTYFFQELVRWYSKSDYFSARSIIPEAAASLRYDAFAETLDTARTLEEILPFCVNRVPYFQRLYANALSRSMRAAMILGDQASTGCRRMIYIAQ
jgi:hypothetical protein